MWLKWLPWKYVIQRFARQNGFLDPLALVAAVRRFAQPSEVREPIELLRAGAVFHARGLINSRVIQHNLDWIWPYWVERQFDPTDEAFIPRAFSLTHVNLTHRNWTAVGMPDVPLYPLVGPHGLLTPHYDGWSLDSWILADEEPHLFPSRLPSVEQRLELGDPLAIVTRAHQGELWLETRVWVEREGERLVCRARLTAQADRPAWLTLALRPFNFEGVSFIHKIALDPAHAEWTIDGKDTVRLDAPAERHAFSRYQVGDVIDRLPDGGAELAIECEVGMATAAALYRLEPGRPRELTATVPLGRGDGEAGEDLGRDYIPVAWTRALEGHCGAVLPDARMQFLYDAAVRTLVLHAPADAYPGPYTYKRFWFRDAAFLIYALDTIGLHDRAQRALARFPLRQTGSGYFHSQEGEWDSNGQALWVVHQHALLSGRAPDPAWATSMRHGARWIVRKRVTTPPDAPHAGLFPAGFSAEHLGPIDYYYWDDFWGVGGLRAAAALLEGYGDGAAAAQCRADADAFMRAIDHSLEGAARRLRRPGMPASPYRRLDAGAIGSLAAGYPLQLFAPEDPRLLDTAVYLATECFHEGGFFQDMIHSGINAYLTLHVAQVLLRAGDPRAFDMVEAVARLATPTGQWPEAIHPRTLGGCMGDGQHVWAAAEWLVMLRNCFVREELTDHGGPHDGPAKGLLVLGAGIPQKWLRPGPALEFGPAPTHFGTLRLTIEPAEDAITVRWDVAWRAAPPRLRVQFAGYSPVEVSAGQTSVRLARESAGVIDPAPV